MNINIHLKLKTTSILKKKIVWLIFSSPIVRGSRNLILICNILHMFYITPSIQNHE